MTELTQKLSSSSSGTVWGRKSELMLQQQTVCRTPTRFRPVVPAGRPLLVPGLQDVDGLEHADVLRQAGRGGVAVGPAGDPLGGGRAHLAAHQLLLLLLHVRGI